MNWLQIRLLGPYFSFFSTNIYGYYSQKSQNLFSNGQIFASAQIIRQAANTATLLRRTPQKNEDTLCNDLAASLLIVRQTARSVD
jgi:hypothetical protein